jgi:exodeoxyribonuclease III
MLKIASWNVNSLKVRLEQVIAWLEESQTDILAIQETKMDDTSFPKEAFFNLGYEVSFNGQKTYNGVAIISRFEQTDHEYAFPDFVDEQKRVLAASINGIRIINFYIPNGQSLESDKYQYKLQWLDHMYSFVDKQLKTHKDCVVLGDFNIAPDDIDVHDPKLWEGSVLVSEAERSKFQKLLRLGMVDVIRQQHLDAGLYSWWDYRAAAFRRGMGLRIDHILMSDALSAKVVASGVDTHPRRHERPSDHAPVWVTLKA